MSVFLVAVATARHPPDEPVEDSRESHDDRPAASHRQVVIPRRQLAHVHATVQQFPHRVEVVVFVPTRVDRAEEEAGGLLARAVAR